MVPIETLKPGIAYRVSGVKVTVTKIRLVNSQHFSYNPALMPLGIYISSFHLLLCHRNSPLGFIKKKKTLIKTGNFPSGRLIFSNKKFFYFFSEFFRKKTPKNGVVTENAKNSDFNEKGTARA